jgi:hypothetical protein
VPDFKCEQCQHSEQTYILLECRQPAAMYRPVSAYDAHDKFAQDQYHSCSHMRGPRGACGQEAKFYKRRSE